MIPTDVSATTNEAYRQWLKPQVAYVWMKPETNVPTLDVYEPIQENSILKRVELGLNSLSSDRFLVPQLGEVRSYLLTHPDMLNTVYKACSHIKKVLGQDISLSLELYVDPEIDDQYLTLYVQQPNCDQSIWDKVERIRENYRDDLADLSGWLQVTLDFRA